MGPGFYWVWSLWFVPPAGVLFAVGADCCSAVRWRLWLWHLQADLLKHPAAVAPVCGLWSVFGFGTEELAR